MFESRLFLGFPIQEEFQKKLQEIDPEILQIFICPQSDYLEQAAFKETVYLGRYVNDVTNLQSLDQLEANVYSLLKKIIPDYPFEKTPLLLFPLSPL